MAADDVALGADQVADLVTADIAADRDDAADEFVARDRARLDRLLRPGVPVVDVDVGAADAGLQHLDQHVVDAVARLRHVLEPDAGFGFGLDECFH